MSKLIDRTGESRLMSNGLKAEIIRYSSSNDIDIRFENGAEVLKKKYANFVSGKIKCPMIIEYIEDYAKATNPNISPAFTFLIDVEDVSLLGDYLWCNNSLGYAGRNGGHILHRMIMNASPLDRVDHKDMNKSDCRKRNLRICTHAENCRNVGIKSHNTSGLKGVSWNKYNKKWQSTITVNGKQIHLGYDRDKLVAAKAYNDAAILYFGEFARLNVI